MFFCFLKLRGLYKMYQIWTAWNTLGIKAEQFRGVSYAKDIAFVSDTIFCCVALGLNCDYMTFYRTDVNIGRKLLKLELGAIVCIQGVKEVDTPLIQGRYSRNVHLPLRFIEKINWTEETPQSLLERVGGGRVERPSQKHHTGDQAFSLRFLLWGINWNLRLYTKRDRDTHRE